MDKTQQIHVDNIWNLLGKWGRYQLMMVGYIFLGMIMFVFTALSFVFTGFTPPHTCKEISTTSSYFNDSIFLKYNVTDYDATYSQCHVDVRMNATNESTIAVTLPCINGYDYKSEGETIVTEWDLVCGNTGRAELTQTLLLVGQLFGSLFFPSFSDRFGRKPVFVFTTLMMFCLLLSLSFVYSYIVFAVMKFFIGAFLEGFVLTCDIYIVEFFPKECRGRISAAGAVLWSFSAMFLAPFGYLLRNYSWRYLQVAAALTSTHLLSCYWFFDESLRWLVANGKTGSAVKVVKRAARWNKIEPEEALKILLQTENNLSENWISTSTHERTPKIEEMEQCCENTITGPGKVERYNILTILRHKTILKVSVILWLTWITNSLTYYGLTLTSSTMAGNRFLNYFLSCAAEVPAGICYLFCIDRKGRKFSSILFHAIAGISMIISVVLLVLEDDTGSLKIVSPVFSLLGKFGISSTFNVILLYTPEMYPTNLRNIGIGLASSAAKLGGMVAPFSMLLVEKAMWAPGVIFGGLCLLVTVLTTLLPETRGHELPQYIEELKVWYKSQNGSKTKRTENESKYECNGQNLITDYGNKE